MAVPFTGELSLAPLFLKLDVAGVLRLAFLPALLTLVIMGLLDTLGTLVGLGAAGGLLDEKGRFPEIEKPMTVDALTCVFAGLVGTTTSGAYIESAAGIREGARTGLAAVTTAALFAACLFFVPLVEPLQRLRYAYAPALVAVGLLMMASARHVDFDDLTELVPAFATIVMMVFTYNIGNGLTAGLLLYPLVKLAAGRGARGEGRRVGARRDLPLLLPLRRPTLNAIPAPRRRSGSGPAPRSRAAARAGRRTRRCGGCSARCRRRCRTWPGACTSPETTQRLPSRHRRSCVSSTGTGKPTPSVEKIQRSTRGSRAQRARLRAARRLDDVGRDDARGRPSTAARIAGWSSGVSQPG